MLRKKFHNPQRSIDVGAPAGGMFSGKRTPLWQNAILTACDRFEANEEIKRQHGPVKILFKDGKPVEQP